MAHTRLTASDITLIQELRRNGETYDSIAEQMNSCYATVKRLCSGITYKKEKVSSTTGVRGLTMEHLKELWKLRDEGKTYREIATIIKVSSKTISKVFKNPRPE